MPVAISELPDLPAVDAMNIAIFAGEYSGDVQGEALATALRQRFSSPPSFDSENPGGSVHPPDSLLLWGIGGSRMRSAGVELRFDSTLWGAMGTYEALKLVPRLLRVLARIKRDLLARRPSVLVLIDFGAFNARAAAWARQQGIRVFYYFPPGSWKRGPIRQGPRSLASISDRIATPFLWSATALREAGADAYFVGHPLLDIVRPSMSVREFRSLHEIPDDARLVCHLPGSRRHELRYNWPVMRAAARLLSDQLPDVRHVVAIAPSVSMDEGTELAPAVRLRAPASVYDALAACDLAITKSGTVTLEAAILGRPLVIMYRGSFIQGLEYRLLHQRRVKFIGMPNILLNRLAFPELIQHQASPDAIADSALPFLTNSEVHQQATNDLKAVREALGEPGAIGRTVDLILELAGRGQLDAPDKGLPGAREGAASAR